MSYLLIKYLIEMNFLKNVLATVVGIFIFCLFSFFLLAGIAAALGGDKGKVEIKNNSVIELDLAKINFDYAGKYTEESPLHFLIEGKEKVGFIDVINAIEFAKTDSKIKGIIIKNNSSMLGLAQTKELHDELKDFKKSGKFIYSYSNVFTQKEYYIASIADKIVLNPAGDVDFKGLHAELLFFKDFQDKTGLKMEVIRHGKYKSAVEPFLNNTISTENKEQYLSLLTSIWESIITDIASNRKIAKSQLNIIADKLLARTPEMALQQKLIDQIAYEDEFNADVRKKLSLKIDDEIETVSIEDYTRENLIKIDDYTKDDIIAIIYAQGEINSGEGDVNYIGEQSVNRALKEAREDKNVKSVVIRIDSPGGNALTSELIWREIELTKKVKPVVVSMGNYAASGGYYIACNATKIFAEPTTITGSIGVFGMLPNVHGMMNKIGINAEQINTHKNAGGYSIFEPISEDFKNFTLEGVDKVYQTFLTRVAKGRKMTLTQVDAIAQGRVWTGNQAKQIGLVDEIGNLKKAIDYAAKLGKSKSYRTESYPEYKKNYDEMFAALAGAKLSQSKEEMIKEELGPAQYEILQTWKRINQRRGIQLLAPYDLKIE